MQSTINLLRPSEKDSVQVATIKNEAQKIAFIVFLTCVSLAVLTLAFSLIFTITLQSAETKNKSYKNQIQEFKQIESLLSVIKTRTPVVEKALAYSKPVDTQITYAHEIALPPTLQSFILDDLEKITVTFKPYSIEEAMAMASTILSFTQQEHIQNPRIDSYGIGEDGMRIVFSYNPVW